MPSTTMEDRGKNHCILALMLDSRIKRIHLVTSYLGHENALCVVDYDLHLLLFLWVKFCK
jgi:hypothetical protein